MNRIKILSSLPAIILILAPAILVSQDMPADTVWNQTDINGYKQGFWKKYYESGILQYSGFFRDNQPLGRMTRYYETGGKMADIGYSPDGNTSYAILYFQDGSRAAEGKFIHHDKDSTWKYYSDNSQTLAIEENYLLGKRHGLSIVYYDNGQIAQKTMWRKDMKHGPWEQFYDDAAVRMVTRFENDKLEGVYQVFNRDGTLVIQGAHKQDLKVGTWKYYNDDGSEDFELIYVDGILQNEEIMKQKLDEFMEEMEKDSLIIPEPDIGDFIQR